MGEGGREADEALPGEDRPHQNDVWQVGAAVIGIVGDEEVAGTDRLAKRALHRTDGERHRAEMEWQTGALGDKLAVGHEQGSREIQGLLHDEGARGPRDRERHLVGNGGEGVLYEFQGEGIARRHRIRPDHLVDGLKTRHQSNSISITFQAIRRTRPFGGTSVVLSVLVDKNRSCHPALGQVRPADHRRGQSSNTLPKIHGAPPLTGSGGARDR